MAKVCSRTRRLHTQALIMSIHVLLDSVDQPLWKAHDTDERGELSKVSLAHAAVSANIIHLHFSPPPLPAIPSLPSVLIPHTRSKQVHCL